MVYFLICVLASFSPSPQPFSPEYRGEGPGINVGWRWGGNFEAGKSSLHRASSGGGEESGYVGTSFGPSPQPLSPEYRGEGPGINEGWRWDGNFVAGKSSLHRASSGGGEEIGYVGTSFSPSPQPFSPEYRGEGPDGPGVQGSWLHLDGSVMGRGVLRGVRSNSEMEWEIDGEKKIIASEAIVAWGGSVAPSRYAQMILTDGTTISGRPVAVTAERTIWESRLWGTIEVPGPWVRAIVLQPFAIPEEWNKVLRGTLNAEGTKDAIIVEGLDWIEGVMEPKKEGWYQSESSDNTISFSAGNQTTIIPWNRIRVLRFSPALTPRISSEPTMTWYFFDGDRIAARSWNVRDDNRIEMELAIPITLTSSQSATKLVGKVSGLDGREKVVRWLADEEPAAYRHVTSWSITMPMGRGESLSGKTLFDGGLDFANGISMPSSSQATYKHDGSEGMFLAEVKAMAPSHRQGMTSGDVRVRVLVSNGGPLEARFDSGLLSPQDKRSEKIEVDLKNCKLLVLIVEASDDGAAADEVWWIRPRICATASQNKK